MHSDIIAVSFITCSAILHEEGGPMSAIRISSVANVPPGLTAKIEALFLVKTEAGKSGKFKLRIVITNPEGVDNDYDFQGDDSLSYGTPLESEAPIPGGGAFSFWFETRMLGTHWIRVFLDDELATRWSVTTRELHS
jgi:hypothetical protein